MDYDLTKLGLSKSTQEMVEFALNNPSTLQYPVAGAPAIRKRFRGKCAKSKAGKIARLARHLKMGDFDTAAEIAKTFRDSPSFSQKTKSDNGFGRSDFDDIDDVEDTEYTFEESSESAVLTTASHDIETVQDALDYAGVDMEKWIVVRADLNHKKVTSKNAQGEATVIPLWQIKVQLKPRQTTVVDLAAIVAKMMDEHKPDYGPLTIVHRNANSSVLAEIDAMDLHIGEYAWARETGSNYDQKIATDRLFKVIEDLAARIIPFKPARILLPIGNDLLHIDNLDNTTNHGTGQDVDTRFYMIFEETCKAVVKVIDRLRIIAPVIVLIIPGNHDTQSCFHLGEVLKAWYRGIVDVTVDNEPRLRKYVLWGKVLLGFTHGGKDYPKLDSMPLLMATEVPQMWAVTTWREWHLGHWHAKKETKYIAGDTWNGVHVRIIPALCGTDAWHYQHGFTGNWRAAEVYIWDSELAYVGHLASLIQPDKV